MKTTFQKICFAFLFSFSIFAFSQDVYVPYRDGKLWGLSDYEGNIIINPKYDTLKFNEQDDYDFSLIHTSKNLKKGLIISGKEVLEPKYDGIYPTYKKYIVTKYTENGKQLTEILDKTGKPILEKPIEGILYSEALIEGLILIHTINLDYTEDLFIWNNREQKIVQYLFKNYYSIKLDFYEKYKIYITYKQYEKDSPTEKKYTFYDLKLSELNSKNWESLVDPQYVKRNTEFNYYGSQEGVKSSYYSLPPTSDPKKADYYENNGDNNDKKATEKPVKKTSYFHIRYNLENNAVYANIQKDYGEKSKKIKIDLPKSATDIKIENLKVTSGKKTVLDSIYTYQNFITYNNKNKRGILIIDKPIEFDSIKVLRYINHGEFSERISFLVGNKNKKTNSYTYSILDTNQELKFPIEFDEIIINDAGGGSDFNNWTVRKNNKFGVIKPTGKIIAETIYDEIINKKIDGENSFLQLKKNNLYGYFSEITSGSLDLLEPVFQYRISGILHHYPYRRGLFDWDNKTYKTIITLVDESGNLLGYANKEGKLYFKN